ncbi:uncharacterized protein LOC128875111 [Hylaeus volcanicus]|uniref:uncharacterized protein LOC128875111 n=1 Tax=Hylaeus volcanicus TaxID=313075 RepID=UPI0023B7FEC9|nr:uncharacterized protein LOC128875111 [Hylaeus volcanicus]
MINQFTSNDHRHWDGHIAAITFAYNMARHEAIGYSPAYLNYGREPIPPSNSALQPPTEDRPSAPPDLRPRIQRLSELEDDHRIASFRQAHATEQQARYFNQKHRNWQPKVGDSVMLREHPLSDASRNFAAKLAPKFSGPYKVTKWLSPNIVEIQNNIFEIMPEHKQWE